MVSVQCTLVTDADAVDAERCFVKDGVPLKLQWLERLFRCTATRELAIRFVQAASDKQQLEPTLNQVVALSDTLGKAETLLADNGMTGMVVLVLSICSWPSALEGFLQADLSRKGCSATDYRSAAKRLVVQAN